MKPTRLTLVFLGLVLSLVLQTSSAILLAADAPASSGPAPGVTDVATPKSTLARKKKAKHPKKPVRSKGVPKRPLVKTP